MITESEWKEEVESRYSGVFYGRGGFDDHIMIAYINDEDEGKTRTKRVGLHNPRVGECYAIIVCPNTEQPLEWY